MRLSVLFALSALVLGCPPGPQPPPQPDGGDPDAGPPVTCSMWCVHALDLKCPSAQPTRRGASCTDVCTNVQSGPAPWNLKCRSTAHSCAEADVCER